MAIGLVVIWDNHSAKSDARHQVFLKNEASMIKLNVKFTLNIKIFTAEVKKDPKHVQGIALRTGYTSMKTMSGDKKMIPT